MVIFILHSFSYTERIFRMADSREKTKEEGIEPRTSRHRTVHQSTTTAHACRVFESSVKQQHKKLNGNFWQVLVFYFCQVKVSIE